jgi:ankyrin repeat domain-containing protein 50
MNTRRSEADNAHPRTCEWLLLHKSYTKWLSNQHGLLWIKGKPGAGKSTLLAFVYRTLPDSSPGQPDLRLEFFFHGRGEKLQKTSIGMFRSLVHQMFIRDKSIREPLRRLFHNKAIQGDVGIGWEWQPPELQNLLSDAILTAAKSRKVTIFIDALDEAGPDAPAIIKFFHVLNDKIYEAHSTAKICISCRHYPITAKIPGLDVVVEDHNNDDIAKYVDAALQSEVRREHADLDPETWRELEEAIIRKSSGIFQWARLVIPIVLDHYYDGDSRAEIFEILARVPDELEDVYEYILSNIIKPSYRERTLQLMQWIFLAERPLTVTEIRYAIASGDKHGSPPPKACASIKDFVESDERMVLVVTTWSGGLAEVQNHEGKRIVQFIHQSVNDFFLSGGLIFLESVLSGTGGTYNKGPSTSYEDDIIGRSHDRLAKSCITYFKLEEVQLDRMLGTNLDHELLPFLDYATRSWFLHAEKAERLGVTQAALVEQFSSPPEILAKWINTYILMDEFSIYCPQEGAKLLHIASGANLKTVVSILLQQNANIEEADNWGSRPLHYALRRGHRVLTEMLLDAGADASARIYTDTSPLMMAAGIGDIEIVKMLLSRGADINDHALQRAALNGNLALIQFLLGAGADVNKVSNVHGIALHYAASRGHEAVVEELISHGADINARNDEYCGALQAAARGGFYSDRVVKLLLEKGANVHARGGERGDALQAAATFSNFATVELLLNAGANVNAEGGTDGNPLQAAAEPGNLATIKILIERGANVNAQGGRYGTALQAAARWNRSDVVDFLLEKGADPNIKGGECGSAIQAAATHGHFTIVQLLIRNKADVNAQGGEWGNPLRAALSKGHIHVALLLLENDAQDHMMNEEFNATLKATAAKGLQELRNFMVGKGPIESSKSSRAILDQEGTARGENTNLRLIPDLNKERTVDRIQ